MSPQNMKSTSSNGSSGPGKPMERKGRSPDNTRQQQHPKTKSTQPKPAQMRSLQSQSQTQSKPTKGKVKENLVSAKPAQKKEDGVKIVEELRERLHKELLDVLEAEQKKEMEREEKLKIANEADKAKLEKAFGIERAKASNRIVTMSEYCE